MVPFRNNQVYDDHGDWKERMTATYRESGARSHQAVNA